MQLRFTILLPEDWTPEQAWAVQDCLDERLVQIQTAITQLDLFGADFDDPLPF
ncbi:hypothetical protein [Thiocapsa rosea]|uniref:Uncharacterized protein n=1 Tax=Thiocapsa rosea TaxID=69360 RepID=A0A495VCQ5_9GAMM|nr:hypothetical protein [Thiocapsa rosea]RKT46560.1 hypothetical protein BDD21_4082 [Thiocapsa rosea]